MIKADPSLANEPVVWTRHGVPIFEKTHNLQFWAEHQVIESSGGSYPKIIKMPITEAK
jgi:hypothetical protein